MMGIIFVLISFLQTLVATAGSLYFSEVMKLTPCLLCWYQRVFMYPLVMVFAVALWRKDRKFWHYVLPLSLPGWAIALYHTFLLHGIINPGIPPACEPGVSCTVNYFALFGFISIPLMSLTAFSIINLCVIIYLLINRPGKDPQ